MEVLTIISSIERDRFVNSAELEQWVRFQLSYITYHQMEV